MLSPKLALNLSLPITIADRRLPAADQLPPTADCRLAAGGCLPPTTYRRLPAADHLPPAAGCLDKAIDIQ